MQTIEITVKVNEDKKSVVKKLKDNGFRQTSDEHGNDIYMTRDLDKLNKDNILELLNTSVLLRHFYSDYRDDKYITLKDKKYKDGKVTSEEIINIKIDDIDNMKKLLERLGFEELVQKKQYFNDYTKDDTVFILEEVEGFGLLIEYENKNDFTGKSDEEIMNVKKDMYETIKSFGIDVDTNYDIKKAYDLIVKKYNLE